MRHAIGLFALLSLATIPEPDTLGASAGGAAFPTRTGRYESGAWRYVYQISAKGTRSERRRGRLYHEGQLVQGKVGEVRQTPVGRFVYFSDHPRSYTRGWLNTLPYDKPTFEKDGSLTAELAASFAQHPERMIHAATTRPWPGKSYPALPELSSAMRQRIAAEIQKGPEVRDAYGKLNAADRRNTQWFEGVKELEEQKAFFSLLSCLCHPHEDVQIHALRALARFKSERAVPFLLVYADHMAVFEGGSENATIHGIIHEDTAKTLSVLTGIEVVLDGQDPEGLGQGIGQWRKWLDEQEGLKQEKAVAKPDGFTVLLDDFREAVITPDWARARQVGFAKPFRDPEELRQAIICSIRTELKKNPNADITEIIFHRDYIRTMDGVHRSLGSKIGDYALVKILAVDRD